MNARLRTWALSILLISSLPGFAEEPGLAIEHAQISRQGDRHLLDADIHYRLTKTAEEALRNGVPLTFALNLEVQPAPYRWWAKATIEQRWSFEVHYHSLAKLFQWTQEKINRPHSFAGLSALLEDLGTVRRLPVEAGATLTAGQAYEARLAVSLDIEALPLPLRPVAYLTPSWYLSSPRHTWSFVE